MFRKGITLRVTADKLAQLIEDLNGTINWPEEQSMRLNVALDYVHARKAEELGEPHHYFVHLDKWQRRFLENKMMVQAWADEYGEAK